MKLLKLIIIILALLLLFILPFLIGRVLFSAGKLVERIPEFANELRGVRNLQMADDVIYRGRGYDRVVEFENGNWVLFKSKHILKYTSYILEYEKPWFIGLKFSNGDILFIVDETGSADKFFEFHEELAALLEKQSYEQEFFMKDIQDLCTENNLVMFRYE